MPAKVRWSSAARTICSSYSVGACSCRRGLLPARSTSLMPSFPTANSASPCRSSIRVLACSSARWRYSGRLRHDLPSALELDRRSARARSVRHRLPSRDDGAASVASLAAPRAQALGLFELKGFSAMLVISVLAAEVVITLTDFVEEDLSRKLPASERVMLSAYRETGCQVNAEHDLMLWALFGTHNDWRFFVVSFSLRSTGSYCSRDRRR